MDVLLNFLKKLFGFVGTIGNEETVDTSLENEQIIQERLRLQEFLGKLTAEISYETGRNRAKTCATRLKNTLDYAVNLVYYKRGYCDDRYPKYLRVVTKSEYSVIPAGEYERRKEQGEEISLATYCNVFERKVLKGCFDYGLYDDRQDPEYSWLDYDPLVLGISLFDFFYNTLPYDFLVLCDKAVGKNLIKERTAEEAQLRANCGVPISAAEPGHEVVVYPDSNPYNDELGPKIAQAGWYNLSNVYASDFRVWGKDWKKKGIRFFEFPYKGKGFMKYPPISLT